LKQAGIRLPVSLKCECGGFRRTILADRVAEMNATRRRYIASATTPW
jgi:hypothetical protein